MDFPVKKDKDYITTFLNIIKSSNKIEVEDHKDNKDQKDKAESAVLTYGKDLVVKAYNDTEIFRMGNLPDKYYSLFPFHSNPFTTFYHIEKKEKSVEEKNKSSINKEKYLAEPVNAINDKIEDSDTQEEINLDTPLKQRPQRNPKPVHSNKKLLGNKRAKKKTVYEGEEYCIKNCLFDNKYANREMIYCEGSCKIWYHIECINMNENKLRELDNKAYICDNCK